MFGKKKIDAGEISDAFLRLHVYLNNVTDSRFKEFYPIGAKLKEKLHEKIIETRKSVYKAVFDKEEGDL